jgi:hypothetical protein
MNIAENTLLFNHHLDLFTKRNNEQSAAAKYNKQQAMLYGSNLIEQGELTEKELKLLLKPTKIIPIGDDSQDGVNGE